ncbi:MAG: hypothetical protein GY842_20085 [bacterium]|nr:hypothetical protein [bacterium]
MNERMKESKEQWRKLKPSELKPLLEDYHRVLPQWVAFQKDALIRANGPVLQSIFFERQSHREYRVLGCVRILVAPGGGGLDRVLPSVQARGHAHAFPKMIEALRREFAPSVDAPLVPEEVLELCEREAIPKSPEAHSLAALNAYLGHEERALYWCRRFPELIDEERLGMQEWDLERRDFLNQLEGWTQTGKTREQLDLVLQHERQKWGLT